MTWLDALLLGALEGLTEFLPVSSTGHLILLGDQLGQHSDAAKTLEIVIQAGAVLAVVVYYRRRLAELVRGLLRREPQSLRLLSALAIAFVPAALVGLLLHGPIKRLLFKPIPVAAALIAGGLAMILIELGRRRRQEPGLEGLEHVTPRRALAIGVGQCLSLWPGASRSMTTIVAGQLSGLGTATAAEFSFLLSIPTLGAATAFDLYKNGRTLFAAEGGAMALAVGMTVAFAVSLLVIAAFLRYLRTFGLVPFGAYRIALGALVLFIASRAVAARSPDAAAPAVLETSPAGEVSPAATHTPN
jgi:undecaprenyl-diphosphatase